MTAEQIAQLLYVSLNHSRRQAKRLLRETLGPGHGTAAELDAALASIADRPDRADIEARAAELAAAPDQVAVPSRLVDNWIVGEGLKEPGRWYVIHTTTPRFVAQVFDGGEPGWLEGGPSWSLSDGQVVGNAEFWDRPPVGASLDRLMLGLGRVLDEYDARTARRCRRAQAAALTKPDTEPAERK